MTSFQTDYFRSQFAENNNGKRKREIEREREGRERWERADIHVVHTVSIHVIHLSPIAPTPFRFDGSF